jgi:hypothetical protein
MRRGLIASGLFTLVLAGCQQPSPSAPLLRNATPYSLLPGQYTMTIYVPGPSSGINVLCVAETAVPDKASFPVGVTAISGGWRVQPAGEANLGLVALLEMYGVTQIVGPVAGQARDPDTQVVVTVSPSISVDSPTQGDAMLDGRVANPTFAAGILAGDVQFVLGREVRFCRPVYWILQGRTGS